MWLCKDISNSLNKPKYIIALMLRESFLFNLSILLKSCRYVSDYYQSSLSNALYQLAFILQANFYNSSRAPEDL